MNPETIVTQSVTTASNLDLSIWGMFLNADIFSKLIMLLLICISIWSWAIIVDKLLRFRTLKRDLIAFDATFWSGQSLEQLYERTKRAVDNPMSAIFVAAMNELKRAPDKSLTADSFLKIGQKDRLMQAMNLVRNREIERIESYLGFLASVGAYAPFVGILGMVWSIMHNFQAIAVSKSVSLPVIAPSIAEALLATALGLIAAIPAVGFYNYLMGKVNYMSNRLDDFIAELYTILSRNIDEDKV